MNTRDGNSVPSDSPGISAAIGEGGSDDPRVIEVVEDYLNQLEKGEQPERAKYLRRYPELAGTIAACLDGLSFVREALPADVVRTNGGVSPFPEGRLECQPGPLGDFQIVKELGRGGMGVVYEAVQISLGRRVALKVLPFASTFEARQLQRFKNEAQAAALLHHQHIVAVHAVGCERGVHFYAMQLIEGQSLAVIIRHWREQPGSLAGEVNGARREIDGRGNLAAGSSAGAASMTGRLRDRREIGRESRAETVYNSTANVSAALTAGASLSSAGYFRRVARLTIQAADALEHAHRLGVVHRDVKPANLLVNTAGDLWVTDFGLAQFHADTGLTRSGELLGTFRYMSPEQTSGHRVVLDHRTDIYSLGATLYELLTLEPVFGGETRQELVYQILHQEPRSPRLVNRAVPVELETIVLKALAKNPAERYGTAAEFASDLQRYLDHEPIRARRPSLVDRARKWSRRHPGVVVASVLLLFVTSVALLVSNRLISRERNKSVKALAELSREQGKTVTALEQVSHEQERTAAALREAKYRLELAAQSAHALIELSETDPAKAALYPRLWLRLLTVARENYEAGGAAAEDEEPRSESAAVRDRLRQAIDNVTLLHQDARILWQQELMYLLWSQAVLDDLGLTADERRVVEDLRQTWLQEWTVVVEETRLADDDARQRRFIELVDRHHKQFTEVLSPTQCDRVREICMQLNRSFIADPTALQCLQLPASVLSPVPVMRTGTFYAVPAFGNFVSNPAVVAGKSTVTLPEGATVVFSLVTDWWKKAGGRPFAPLYEQRTSQASDFGEAGLRARGE